MPIYSFRCNDCEVEFDEICSYEERAKIKCPHCSRVAAAQITAPAGHRYYGPPDNGFYKTSLKAP